MYIIGIICEWSCSKSITPYRSYHISISYVGNYVLWVYIRQYMYVLYSKVTTLIIIRATTSFFVRLSFVVSVAVAMMYFIWFIRTQESTSWSP